MGMHFVFADSISDALDKDAELYIEDEIDTFIYNIKEYIDVISKGSADVLIDLEPYDHDILSNDKIEKLLILGKTLLNEELIDYLKYLKLFNRYDIDEKEYIDFANNLIEVCSKAIEENKQIVSLGD